MASNRVVSIEKYFILGLGNGFNLNKIYCELLKLRKFLSNNFAQPTELALLNSRHRN